MNRFARHGEEYVNVAVDKKKYILLWEAMKCPIASRQFVLIDLGYSKAKVTTECLYRAINNQILYRALLHNQGGDGLYVRINKQLLHENALAYQDENEDSGWES